MIYLAPSAKGAHNVALTLVWGSATPEGIEIVRNEFGFVDVLTVESCIDDLLKWQNHEYQKLLSEREQWVASLFNGLRGGSGVIPTQHL